MTNDPGLAGTQLIEFGQAGEYHTHSMSAAKQSAGYAPLETLPAEWFNNYMNLLDTHINQLQTLILQLQTELVNIIGLDTSATPSATTLTQARDAVKKYVADSLPEIATGSVAGTVVSSGGIDKVSVNASTGVMSVNALSDWSTTDTIAEAIESVGDNVDSEETARKGKDVDSFTGSVDSDNNLSLTITSSDTTTHTAQVALPASGGIQNLSVVTQSSVSAAAGEFVAVLLSDSAPSPGDIISLRSGNTDLPIYNSIWIYTESTHWVPLSECPRFSYTAASLSQLYYIIAPLGNFKPGSQYYYAPAVKVTSPVTESYDSVTISYLSTTSTIPTISLRVVGSASAANFEAIDTADSVRVAAVSLGRRATSATSATYLRPESSTSTLVTADASGNLKAHTLTLS